MSGSWEHLRPNGQTNLGILCSHLVEAVVHEWSREDVEEFLLGRMGMDAAVAREVLE